MTLHRRVFRLAVCRRAGIDVNQNSMAYCDAGIAPPGLPDGSPLAGYIYRIEA